ncbi:Dynein light chain roadblock-type 2, partial [Armadillidium vulgare]
MLHLSFISIEVTNPIKVLFGVIVINAEGVPVKSTLDNPTTIQYTGLISGLTDKARSVVRDLDPTNDLTFLRVRSKKHEIMIAPGNVIFYQNLKEKRKKNHHLCFVKLKS